MKVQEVILRAMAKRITWWQAAEIVGISDRSMRRWRERYQEFGYDGLFDKRRGKASPRRVPMALAEQVLQFYREKYFDLNVLHFHRPLHRGLRVTNHASHGLLLSPPAKRTDRLLFQADISCATNITAIGSLTS